MWVSELRDLITDFKDSFGADADNVQIAFIAVASDADNTGEEAQAGFADIRLIAKEQV